MILGRYWIYVGLDNQVYYYDSYYNPYASLTPFDHFAIAQVGASEYLGFVCRGVDGRAWITPPPTPYGG